jgi:hypothetical protein
VRRRIGSIRFAGRRWGVDRQPQRCCDDVPPRELEVGRAVERLVVSVVSYEEADRMVGPEPPPAAPPPVAREPEVLYGGQIIRRNIGKVLAIRDEYGVETVFE